MAKQRTDNLELVLLDDVDTESFYADHVENLNKINDADKLRQADLAAARSALSAQAVAMAIVFGG